MASSKKSRDNKENAVPAVPDPPDENDNKAVWVDYWELYIKPKYGHVTSTGKDPQKPVKGDYMTAVLKYLPKIKTGGVHKPKVATVMEPDVETDPDVAMKELIAKLADLGVTTAQAQDMAQKSGAGSWGEFKQLDTKGLDEVLDATDGVKLVTKSKVRTAFKKESDQAVVKKGKTPNRAADPFVLENNPKPQTYKLWRDQIEDWLRIHRGQDFQELTLYSVLLKAVPEEDRHNYHHIVDSMQRDCASLLDYLDKTHARLTQLDKTEDIAKYRNCTRRGRGLKEWRQEWERMRKIALRAGLQPSSQDKQDFVTAAELTDLQLSQVHAGMSRAQDLHDEKVWPDGVKVEFDELAAAIKEISHYEYAEQSAQGGKKSTKVPKDSDKALYAGMGYSEHEVAEAVYAYFGKGKGKGKGKGLGKGDNGASTKEQKPAGWKEPCQFGAGCRNMNTTCKGWHPRAKGKGKGKGKGEQRSKSEPPNANRTGSARIGGSDRDCPGCGVKVFATKLNCFKCGIKVEPVPGRPPNKGGKGQH